MLQSLVSSAVVPGAKDIDEFWSNLQNGVDSVKRRQRIVGNLQKHTVKKIADRFVSEEFLRIMMNLILCFSIFPNGRRILWIPNKDYFRGIMESDRGCRS